MRAILDDELLDTLSGMIYFQNWRNVITYKFDFMSVSGTLIWATDDMIESGITRLNAVLVSLEYTELPLCIFRRNRFCLCPA